MTELCRLATKYKTDKIHYTPFYSLLLEGRRESTHRVLEIGIGTPEAMKHVPGYRPGASLRMWKEYFPYAVIDGVDKQHIPNVQEERINVWVADQGNAGQLKNIVSYDGFQYDLIVDDGSHQTEDQRISFDTLYSYLKPGGLYIIEDINEEWLKVPHTFAYVHGELVGRCAVIRG